MGRKILISYLNRIFFVQVGFFFYCFSEFPTQNTLFLSGEEICLIISLFFLPKL